jgi:hypothetical protein
MITRNLLLIVSPIIGIIFIAISTVWIIMTSREEAIREEKKNRIKNGTNKYYDGNP